MLPEFQGGQGSLPALLWLMQAQHSDAFRSTRRAGSTVSAGQGAAGGDGAAGSRAGLRSAGLLPVITSDELVWANPGSDRLGHLQTSRPSAALAMAERALPFPVQEGICRLHM